MMRPVLFFSLSLVMAVAGFNVQLKVTPPAISYPLTEEVKMTCSLDQWLLKNKLTYISSILVTRDNGNTYVASLTPHGPPNVFTDKNLLKVTGSLSGLSDNQTFLQLVWSYPTRNQSGTYNCEINGLDTFGRAVKKSKSLDLETSAPNMDEIAEYVQMNTEKVDKMEKTLTGRLDYLTQAVLSLQTKEGGVSEMGESKAAGYGFKVDFVSSPAVINYPVTEEIELRCSLEESTTDTVKQLAHIVSLSVSRSRDASIVASVNQHEGARGFVDGNKVSVNGSIDGVKGMVELIWNAPSPAQSDVYRCDISCLSQQGHVVTLTKTLEVSTNDSSFEQMSSYIQGLSHTMKAQQKTMTSLQETTLAQEKILAEYKSSITSLQQFSHHTEAGRIMCSSFTKKSGSLSWSQQTITTSFDRAYDATPKLIVAIADFNEYGGSADTRVGVKVTSVDRYRFKVECITRSSHPVNNVEVVWLSTD